MRPHKKIDPSQAGRRRCCQQPSCCSMFVAVDPKANISPRTPSRNGDSHVCRPSLFADRLRSLDDYTTVLRGHVVAELLSFWASFWSFSRQPLMCVSAYRETSERLQCQIYEKLRRIHMNVWNPKQGNCSARDQRNISDEWLMTSFWYRTSVSLKQVLKWRM